MTAALDVTDLTVSYGEVRALEHCTLSLERGTITGLIGMNGSGKTTLMRAVTGAVRAAHGTVTVEGTGASAARRAGRIAAMPQHEDVDWAFPLSVTDVVMTGRYGHLGLTRRPRARDRRAVTAAIARVGLTDLADRQIGRLSGGQRKRAFIARAIVQEASLLLLDEPFAGVDTRSQATMTALLRELAADGRTVLISTHDLDGLPELADRAALLRQRVLFHGPVADALTPDVLARAFGLGAGGRP